jgi:hypothetical protein
MGKASICLLSTTISSQTYFNHFKWDPSIHSVDEQVALFCVCLKGTKMQMAMIGNFPHPHKVGGQGNGVKE